LLLRGAGRQLTLPQLARLASAVDTCGQGQRRIRLSAEYVRQYVAAATHTPNAHHGCPLGRPLALGGVPELVRRGGSSVAVPTLLGFEPPLVRCSSVCFPPTSGPATTVGGCGPSAAASTAISSAALDATDDSATRQTRRDHRDRLQRRHRRRHLRLICRKEIREASRLAGAPDVGQQPVSNEAGLLGQALVDTAGTHRAVSPGHGLGNGSGRRKSGLRC
jgi:hypothetical protein